MNDFLRPFDLLEDGLSGDLIKDVITPVAEEGETDYAGDSSTTGVITVDGERESGTIGGADDASDWLAITLDSALRYRVDSVGARLDVFELTIVDSDGNVITTVEPRLDNLGSPTGDFVFQVDTSGDYFLQIRVPDGAQRGYDFAVETFGAAVRDDFSADADTTGIVTLGEDITGRYDEFGDSDWFAVTVTAGQRIAFFGSSDGAIGPNLTLRNADGSVVEGVESGGLLDASAISYTATADGTLYLDVSGNGQGIGTNYTVQTFDLTDDPSGDVDTAASVAVGDSYEGEIVLADDVDWIRIDGETGQTILFEEVDPTAATQYRLYDETGALIGSGLIDDGLRFELTGTTYIGVSGDGSTLSDYGFSLSEVPADLPDTLETTAVAAPDAPFTSTLLDATDGETRDTDFIRLDIDDDMTDGFIVRLEAVDGTFPVGVRLTVVGPNFQSFRSETSSNDPIEFTQVIVGNRPDELYVSVEGFGEAGDAPFEYRVSVTPLEDDAIASNFTAAVVQGSGGDFAGTINFAGDLDYIQIDGDEGDIISLSVTYDNPENASFAVLQESGNPIVFGDVDAESGVGTVAIRLDDSGSFFLRVSGPVGEYQVATTAIQDDFADDTQTLVALGEEVTSATQFTNDADRFTFEGEADTLYRIVILEESDDFSALNGVFVELSEEQRVFLGRSDLNTNANDFITFDGDFIVRTDADGTLDFGFAARSLSSRTFILEAVEDDFSDTVDGATLVSTNAFQLGRYDGPRDRDTFAFDIEAGETLFFEGPGGQFRILDAEGNVVNGPDGEPLVDAPQFIRTALTFTSAEAGRFYLEVSPEFDQPGLYGFAITSSQDDVSDVLADAPTLGVEVPTTVFINSADDSDLLRVDLLAGQTLNLRAFDNGPFRRDAVIEVLDAEGNLLTTNGLSFTEFFPFDTFLGPLNTLTTDVDATFYLRVSLSEDTRLALDDADAPFGTVSVNNFEIDVIQDGQTTLAGNDDGRYTIGGDGDDMIFGDRFRPIDPDSAEGQLFRAYQAVFDRAPDIAGFNIFLAAIQTGQLTNEQVLTDFVTSPEFTDLYGDLDERGFVEQLYRNVLDREGDADGVNAFTAALESGQLTRAQVVSDFANSPEFIGATALSSARFAVQRSVEVAEGQVFRLYQAVFDRAPDTAGFELFVNALQADIFDVEAVAAEFVGSDEFVATYGGLDNADFVELLYDNVLPGNEDPVGRAAFTAALDAGDLTRAEVVATFSESFELRSATQDALQGFLNNSAFAFSYSDTIYGGAGSDTLYGGRGYDRFYIDSVGGGDDTILDFEIGVDSLNISPSFVGENAFLFRSDFEEIAEQVGADLVLDFGNGTTLTLLDTDFEEFFDRASIVSARLIDTDDGSAAEKPPIDPVSEWVDVDVLI